MKKALVIGKGISGSSAKRLLEEKGYVVAFIDTSSTFVEDRYEFGVLSPGIDRRHPFVKKIAESVELISEVELALSYAKCHIIGVTGTNGKSSLVSYLGKMLQAKVCGNIGITASDVLPYLGADEWAVVELSSFQLELTRAQKLDVAILLQVTEDHLDRYESFEEYKQTKYQIKNLVKPGGHFYQEEEGDFREGEFFLGPVMEIIRKVKKEIGGSIARADKEFTPLEHRLEKVSTRDGICYINDSKSTTPASVLHALKKVSGNVVLLLGGRDKSSDFSQLSSAITGKVKAVICFGEAAEKIKKSLQCNSFVYTVEKMDHAIIKGLSLVRKGDTLLFSPGCTSYDEFSNFEARGKEFKRKILEEVGDE